MKNNKLLAPIVLFVYNRPDHTKKTVEALKKNRYANESNLFIFSDAPKNKNSVKEVRKVREYIKSITGFKNITIKEAKTNKGLANSVIEGVTEIIDKYGKVIVLEDDLITSVNFLEYMNEALEFYNKDKKIWSISGYNPPIKIPGNYKNDVYLGLRASSWGWATWDDRWDKNDWEVKDYSNFKLDKKSQKLFNHGGDDMSEMLKNQMEGKIDSWAIRWCYNQFKTKTFTIFPIISKVQNIGMDGSGVHCGRTEINNVILDKSNKKIIFIENLKENSNLIKQFKDHYKPKTIKGKIALFLKKIKIYEYLKGKKTSIKLGINYLFGK